MKRICLFAGYNKHNIIEDYVLYYIKELAKISDVYYLADNSVIETEKLIPYTKAVYGYYHGKYDFGSWQELIHKIGYDKLSEYDELILTNDSVFGPLCDLKDYIENLEKDKWDMCGINTAYEAHAWHLSSYFLILKKNVFLSDIFKQHIDSIKQEDSVGKIIEKYEIGLSKKVIDAGFIVKNSVEFEKNIYFFWRQFLLAGSPLIKRKIFNDELFLICRTIGWEEFIHKHSNYDTTLLYQYTNQFRNKFRILRIIKNKVYWQYVGRRILKIVITKERKLIRIFGINFLNIYNYKKNKIKLINNKSNSR